MVCNFSWGKLATAAVDLAAWIAGSFLGWEKDAIHVILCGRDVAWKQRAEWWNGTETTKAAYCFL
jgi:hypothetical protein